MNFKNQTFRQSVYNALRGIKQSIGTERNLKLQLMIAALLIILGFFLKFSPMDWAIITLTSVGVLSVEMINTAIENTVDMFCQGEYHPLAKNAKDVAAGAVLMVSIGAMIIGCIIILPKIVHLIK